MGSKNLYLNSGFSFATSILLVAAGLFTKIALTRLMTVDEFGVLVICQTFFSMLLFAAGLSLNDAVVKFIGAVEPGNDYQKKLILSEVLKITVVSSLFFCAFYYVISNLIVAGDKSKTELVATLNLFALFVPFKLASDMIGSAYQGTGQLYVKMIIVDIFPVFFFITGLGILYFLEVKTFGWIIFIYLIPFAATLLIFPGPFKITGILKAPKNNALRKELIRFSCPLFFAGIVSWPEALVPFIIGLVLPAESVSYYSLSLSLASFIYLSATAVEAAGLSVWAGYLSANNPSKIRDDYRRTTRLGIIVGSIIFFVLVCFPAEIVIILFGARFEYVANILPIMSVIFFINLITGPTESLLKVYGDTHFIFKVRLIVSGFTLLAIYPLLKLFGLNGAIFTFGLSAIIGGVGMYSWRIYRAYEVHPFNELFFKSMFSILVSGLSAILFMKILPKSNIEFFLILQGAVLYVIFLVVTLLKVGAFSDVENNAIKSFVENILKKKPT